VRSQSRDRRPLLRAKEGGGGRRGSRQLSRGTWASKRARRRLARTLLRLDVPCPGPAPARPGGLLGAEPHARTIAAASAGTCWSALRAPRGSARAANISLMSWLCRTNTRRRSSALLVRYLALSRTSCPCALPDRTLCAYSAWMWPMLSLTMSPEAIHSPASAVQCRGMMPTPTLPRTADSEDHFHPAITSPMQPMLYHRPLSQASWVS
jgi:hypothetical protein